VKESEFIKCVASECEGCTEETTARSAARWIKEAGFKFDPEEEPLPDRFARKCGGLIFFYNGRSPSWVKAGVIHPAYGTGAEELIRRGNAWPEIRALVERLPVIADHEGRVRLLAILDGAAPLPGDLQTGGAMGGEDGD